MRDQRAVERLLHLILHANAFAGRITLLIIITVRLVDDGAPTAQLNFGERTYSLGALNTVGPFAVDWPGTGTCYLAIFKPHRWARLADIWPTFGHLINSFVTGFCSPFRFFFW